MDPYPARRKENDFKKENKPRVPPYTHMEKLLALKKEKEDIEEQKAAKAKKQAEAGDNKQFQDDDPKGGAQQEPDDAKFDLLKAFDFPEDLKGQNISLYNSDKLTLYDIFNEYGTEVKPGIDPKNDPEPPKPKEKSEIKSPVKKIESPPKEEEEKEGEGEGAEDPESPSKIVEEEPEEVFIPPVEKVLWYDFDAYDGKDPVLLALMQIDL